MRSLLFSASALTAFAFPALAQDVQTYLYDANGRLVAATNAATTSSWTRYSLDAADNRSNRTRETIGALAVQNELREGEQLLPSQFLKSLDNRFELRFQTDGNLILYFGFTVLWSTATATDEGMTLSMQGDGDLVLYRPTLTPLWRSDTDGYPHAFLRLQNDGNLVIWDGSIAVWSSNTCCH